MQDPYSWRDGRNAGVGAEAGSDRFKIAIMYRRHWRQTNPERLAAQWLVGAELRIAKGLELAAGAERYMRVGPHGCDLHPRPVPRPFVALLYEFQ